MAGNGPAPKHPSTRTRARSAKASGFRMLPSQGRTGAPPCWPLQADLRAVAELEVARDKVAALQVAQETETDGRKKGRLRRQLEQHEMTVATLTLQLEQANDAETALWRELWRTPQAVVWEEAHAAREVAQYVRWKIRGEQGDLEAAKEARMLSDRLGLNPLALLRLRAEIERADEAEDRGKRRRQVPAKKPKDGDDEDPRGLFAVS